jgi:hypothetical protein
MASLLVPAYQKSDPASSGVRAGHRELRNTTVRSPGAGVTEIVAARRLPPTRP